MFYSNPQRESSHSSSSSAFFGEQQSSSSFFSPVVQPKLNVNSPGDKYEQEADAMADKVTSMTDKVGPMSAGHNTAPAIQRKCAKCEEEEKKQNVMRKATNDGGFEAPPHFESKLADTKGGGSPMAADTRSYMENAFQADLSHVRIHNNAAATSMSSTIQAKAFTHGSDIYFNSGQYNPGTKEGKHLLAHELTHTQQQGKTGSSLQRQPADGGTAVPFEKYGESVESSYRQAGLVKEANAVQYCRVWGECGRVLTEHEAYEMYRSGRITAGLEQQPGSGQQANTGGGGVSQGNAGGGGVSPANAGVAGAPLAVGALRATATTAVEGAAQSGTTTALEQAAVRWGTASVVEGGATAATATESTAALTAIEGGLGTTATAAEGAALTTVAEGTATAAAPAAGAGVATVAIPVAIGVVVVVAAVDLFSYASFQAKLQSLGFTILPAPLGVCIANCHQPKAPLTNKWSQPSPWMTQDPFPQPWTQQNPYQPQSSPWGPITSWRGPMKPLKPVTPTTTPAKPATPATPTTTPGKPAGPGTKPATPAKPATPVKPATPATPKTTPVKPATPATPAKPATPTTTPKPAAPTTKPAKPAAPDTKPAKPAEPVKRTSPDKRTKKKTSPKPGEVTYPIPFPHTSPWSDEDDDTSRRCRTEWIESKFGRYPCHSDYAKLFSGTRLEYRVTTQQGLSADFDAIRGDVLYEVKTGYEWMLNKNLGTKMQDRKRQTLARFWAQSINQMQIAMECGYDLEWYFNSKPLAEMMKEELPHVDVKWRPYNCKVDSDDKW
ncbi:eCIS core domain-containing protein [Chitinophaga silvisoli]|nr:DUF4157 domain-containing protein [Chitinophaga silvisoli]